MILKLKTKILSNYKTLQITSLLCYNITTERGVFMYSYKVMIHPNNKQQTKIRRTLNKCIECNNIIYDYLDYFMKNKLGLPKCGDVRKWFTVQKSIKDNEIIEKRKGLTKKEMISNHLDTLFYDVSNDALKQEIKDTYNSFIRCNSYIQKIIFNI